MTDAAPTSRDALLALLAELAGEPDPSPERLSAAREAVRSGLLGPPDEALVEDTTGRAVPALGWAVARGDVEMTERLLEQGANPLAVTAGESPLRSAHRRLGDPEGRRLVQLVRAAARAASERSATPTRAVTTSPREPTYALSPGRGALD